MIDMADLDGNVIAAIQNGVRVFRENNMDRPDAAILAPGLLPDDTASIFGMNVLISPYIPAGTIMVTTQETLDEVRESIARLDQ